MQAGRVELDASDVMPMSRRPIGLHSFAARPPLILVICLAFALVIVSGALPNLFTSDTGGRRAKSRELSSWFRGSQGEVVVELTGDPKMPSSSSEAGARRRDKVAIAHFMVNLACRHVPQLGIDARLP